MNDQPGDDASPPAQPLRGMIDPELHRPAAPPPPPSDEPLGAVTGRPHRSRDGDLLADASDDAEDAGAPGADELRVDAAPTALVRLARTARARPGRTLAAVIALALVVSAMITVRIVAQERRETFSQGQVMRAVTAFRETSSSNSILPIGSDRAADGSADAVAVSPTECTPLVSLRPEGVIGGAEWVDVSGPTYDTTQLQILRFDDPRSARATLTSLSDSLSRCRTVEITYAAGVDPETQVLLPDPSSTGQGRFGYRTQLVGMYYYDVRQFGNTVIWVYGSGADSRAIRVGAASDLIAELQRLAGE